MPATVVSRTINTNKKLPESEGLKAIWKDVNK